MTTRHPFSNLKTRAQAAFRFTYSPPFDTADDNETTARDCDPVCMCNAKPRTLGRLLADGYLLGCLTLTVVP